MSIDESVARRRPRRRRWPLLLAGLLALLLLLWIVLPLAYVGGVRVDEARLLAPGEPDGSRRPAHFATPRRVAVTFSTARDLETMRADEGLGFVTAALFACDEPTARTEEVVTQGDGYLPDEGRVRKLPSAPAEPGRHRYRAIFDDRLMRDFGNEGPAVPAVGVPGGLCFTLDGGSMVGKLWSNRVELRLPAGWRA